MGPMRKLKVQGVCGPSAYPSSFAAGGHHNTMVHGRRRLRCSRLLVALAFPAATGVLRGRHEGRRRSGSSGGLEARGVEEVAVIIYLKTITCLLNSLDISTPCSLTASAHEPEGATDVSTDHFWVEIIVNVKWSLQRPYYIFICHLICLLDHHYLHTCGELVIVMENISWLSSWKAVLFLNTNTRVCILGTCKFKEMPYQNFTSFFEEPIKFLFQNHQSNFMALMWEILDYCWLASWSHKFFKVHIDYMMSGDWKSVWLRMMRNWEWQLGAQWRSVFFLRMNKETALPHKVLLSAELYLALQPKVHKVGEAICPYVFWDRLLLASLNIAL